MKATQIFKNGLIATNALLLFFAFFGEKMQVPLALQIAGRMHPMLLHFPIVLLILVAIWESKPALRSQKTIGDSLLLITAFSAAIVGLAGIFLSKEGDFDEKTLFLHQWSGVAVSVFAWIWFAFRDYFRSKKSARQAIIFGSLASVFMAGHQGAGLTHGADFLWQPLEKPVPNFSKKQPVAPAEVVVFTDLVQPILVEKCQSCHNSKKTKGDLNLETIEFLKKGGKNGPIFDPTAPDLGEMMRRIHAPESEKPHMPPAGKPQLTAAEIQILELWVKNGADFQQKLADLPENDPLRLLADDFFNKDFVEKFDFPAADPDLIEKLNNECRNVRPVAVGSPGLAVGFLGISSFKTAFLKDLAAIKTQIVSLNLARMPVGDADLAEISQFSNLQNLNLNATKISGATLGEVLKNAKNLRQISLSETSVKMADLQFLGNLPQLERVFLWKTAVADPADFEVLRKNFPKIRFENGFNSAGIVAKLNAPVIQTEREVFTNSTRVRLKNYIAGAEIRYTLDGSLPDSLTSILAGNDSILIEKTAILTAKTFLPGWISSEVSTKQFYKIGALPDSFSLVFQPNPQYKGSGLKTIFDQKIGETDFRTPKWVAFREQPLEAFLFFDRPTRLSSVSLSGLIDIGSYIMPPTSVEIWGGPDKNHLILLKKISPEQPKKLGMAVQKLGFTANFEPREIRVLKIIAQPVQKLPPWHPGKGERGWLFLDEVFLN